MVGSRGIGAAKQVREGGLLVASIIDPWLRTRFSGGFCFLIAFLKILLLQFIHWDAKDETVKLESKCRNFLVNTFPLFVYGKKKVNVESSDSVKCHVFALEALLGKILKLDKLKS